MRAVRGGCVKPKEAIDRPILSYGAVTVTNGKSELVV